MSVCGAQKSQEKLDSPASAENLASSSEGFRILHKCAMKKERGEFCLGYSAHSFLPPQGMQEGAKPAELQKVAVKFSTNDSRAGPRSRSRRSVRASPGSLMDTHTIYLPRRCVYYPSLGSPRRASERGRGRRGRALGRSAEACLCVCVCLQAR